MSTHVPTPGLAELRCGHCHRLLCRHSGEAVIELKCGRCKKLMRFRPLPPPSRN